MTEAEEGREAKAILAADWVLSCPTDPPLLKAMLDDVNACRCRFIWARDVAGDDADGIRRVQSGNSEGMIKAVDDRIGEDTVCSQQRNVTLKTRGLGGYGQPGTFELAFSDQHWHSRGGIAEEDRDVARAIVSRNSDEHGFLNCGEYVLVKMLQADLCCTNDLVVLASAVAQRRTSSKGSEASEHSGRDSVADASESDDDSSLPDATLHDVTPERSMGWQAFLQARAEYVGGQFSPGENNEAVGGCEDDLIAEALDPSRSATLDFRSREPQRGDIAWVVDGDFRRHVGIVVGHAEHNGMVGIAGLNGASNFAAHGFRWGPKIEFHPRVNCRVYTLEDTCTHFIEYCRGLKPESTPAFATTVDTWRQRR